MTYVLGIVIVALAVGLVVWLRLSRRDEMFAGLTPGLLPAAGQPAERVRITGGQAPPIAVRFDPPAGVQPALAGLIAGPGLGTVAVPATLIDLAARGWLTLSPLEPVAGSSRRSTAARDWELRALDPPPAEQLSPTERAVLGAAFAHGPVTSLFEFRSRGAGLAETFSALDVEARERAWFQPPPPVGWAAIGSVVAFVGLFLLFSAGSLFPIGAGLLLGGLVVVLGTRRLPVPVTAEGYAARVQALGFKQYLATAEADQLRFEAGIERFSRYLPYAMVFGVVDHWRHVFADALQQEHALGNDDFTGLGWLNLGDVLTTMVLIDLLTTDGGLMDDFVGDFGGGDFSGDWGDAGADGGDTGFGGDGGAGDGGFDGGSFGGFDGGDFGGGFGE
ncbi:MAG: DUF2207 domain-containing protein [Propionibacteriaceae bacterium]|nr:DUF2207 domain-containing protein [Propionibacteriaceae bacterium]